MFLLTPDESLKNTERKNVNFTKNNWEHSIHKQIRHVIILQTDKEDVSQIASWGEQRGHHHNNA